VGHLVPFDGSHEIERCMCDACAQPLDDK